MTSSRLEKTGYSGDTDVFETDKTHRATVAVIDAIHCGRAVMQAVLDLVRDMEAALGRSETDMQGKRNDHRIFQAQ